MSRYVNRLSNLSNRAVLLVLIAVALLSSAASLVVNLINNVDTTPGWWVSWLQNFSTEMFGAFLTFILLTLVVGNRQEKERLIRQMGSRVNEEAIRAVEELRAHGWLRDGSLQGANLMDANLQGASLLLSHLEEAWLNHANLQGADLTGANLQKVELLGANLQGAKLWRANLQGANLTAANLQGANLKAAELQEANLGLTNLQGASLLEANLQNAQGNARFDENTILPDSSNWTPETDLRRFTDPVHSEFWRSNDPRSSAYQTDGEWWD